MYKKRLMSLVLVIILTLSLVGNSFAADGSTEIKIGSGISFEDLRKLLDSTKSEFKNKNDSIEFRDAYWEHLYPLHTEEPGNIQFNEESVFGQSKVLYYGWSGMIDSNPKDIYGNLTYLGYTADNRYVTNVYRQEGIMRSPEILDIDKFIRGELGELR